MHLLDVENNICIQGFGLTKQGGKIMLVLKVYNGFLTKISVMNPASPRNDVFGGGRSYK